MTQVALTLAEAGVLVRAYLAAAPDGDPITLWDREIEKLDALMQRFLELTDADMAMMAAGLGQRCGTRADGVEIRVKIFRFLRNSRRWLLARRFDAWCPTSREGQAAKGRKRGQRRVAGAKAARGGQ